jgi:hypothetical protein
MTAVRINDNVFFICFIVFSPFNAAANGFAAGCSSADQPAEQALEGSAAEVDDAGAFRLLFTG